MDKNRPMDTESLEFNNEEHRDALLAHLRDKVFHVTTKESHEGICRDGCICNNRVGNYKINTGSAMSFGRANGWVCLFDLRGKSEKIIEDSLICYNFLGPDWFAEYFVDRTEWNIVYLLLSPNYHQNLIPDSEASKVWSSSSGNMQYVPKVECWYPGNLPIDYIQKAIQVRISNHAPKHPLLYAQHMLALEEQNKDKVVNAKVMRPIPAKQI